MHWDTGSGEGQGRRGRAWEHEEQGRLRQCQVTAGSTGPTAFSSRTSSSCSNLILAARCSSFCSSCCSSSSTSLRWSLLSSSSAFLCSSIWAFFRASCTDRQHCPILDTFSRAHRGHTSGAAFPALSGDMSGSWGPGTAMGTPPHTSGQISCAFGRLAVLGIISGMLPSSQWSPEPCSLPDAPKCGGQREGPLQEPPPLKPSCGAGKGEAGREMPTKAASCLALRVFSLSQRSTSVGARADSLILSYSFSPMMRHGLGLSWGMLGSPGRELSGMEMPTAPCAP